MMLFLVHQHNGYDDIVAATSDATAVDVLVVWAGGQTLGDARRHERRYLPASARRLERYPGYVVSVQALPIPDEPGIVHEAHSHSHSAVRLSEGWVDEVGKRLGMTRHEAHFGGEEFGTFGDEAPRSVYHTTKQWQGE